MLGGIYGNVSVTSLQSSLRYVPSKNELVRLRKEAWFKAKRSTFLVDIGTISSLLYWILFESKMIVTRLSSEIRNGYKHENDFLF